jgi:DNA-binding transcriptional MerR regulator
MGIYRMQDLMKATGLTRRVIRFYVHRELLPPADGRGTGPVYDEEHLIRLRAVRRLRAERLNVAQIKARLAKLSPAEIAQLGAVPGAVGGPGGGPADAAGLSGPSTTGHFPGAERWERIVLLPGMELHVRADAGPLVQRTAEEIRSRYSAALPVVPARG